MKPILKQTAGGVEVETRTFIFNFSASVYGAFRRYAGINRFNLDDHLHEKAAAYLNEYMLSAVQNHDDAKLAKEMNQDKLGTFESVKRQASAENKMRQANKQAKKKGRYD